MTPTEIAEFIGQKRQVTLKQMRGLKKEKKFYFPRKECYYVIKEIYPSMSDKEIGFLFNRVNIAQIGREKKSIYLKMKSDPSYKDVIERWVSELKLKL